MRLLGYGGAGALEATGGFFNKSPTKEANKYLNQIPGQAGNYLNPYIDAGKNSLPLLQDQYTSLLNSPGQKLNDIGQNYQQSPGFKFALDQALGAGNRSSAAGGMAGSPAAQQANMATATGLANQDYNNWLTNALELYGQGLTGQQGMAQMGQNSATSMTDLISSILAQQGNMAYGEQSAENQNWGDIFGDIAGYLPLILGL